MFKRISHIGVVVEDLERATRFWCETYGLEKYREYETPVECIRACLLSIGGDPTAMSIELIEPLDKSDMRNPVARRLARAGEGFYHLAVEVEDVVASAAALIARKLPVMHRDPVEGITGERWLLHPHASNGIMVEGL